MSPSNDNELMRWPWYRWAAEFLAIPTLWLAGFALILLISAAHGGSPVLRIVAQQDDSGRTITATVEGFSQADCERWRDVIGAAMGNRGFTIQRQACEP